MGLKVKMLCQTTFNGTPLSVGDVTSVPKEVALRWADRGIAKISSKSLKAMEKSEDEDSDEKSLENEDENEDPEGEEEGE